MATGRNGSFNISTSNQFVSGYVSWNETYDIANNSSVVTAELRLSRTNTGYETYSSGEFYIAINGNEKRNSGTFSFAYNSNTLCVSHSVTVAHNADGSKNIEIYAGGELYYISPGLTVSTQSATVSLTTIPRASTLSVPNGTLGSTIRLTVNRASTAFTHTINWSAGGQSGSLTSVGAYVDWSIPYAIANGNTSGTSVTCSFTLITYNSGTEIGRSTASCTLYIPNNSTTKPSLTLGNITVTNSGNISLWSEAVKGKSTLNLSVSSASGKYGATIISYRITTTDGKSSNTSSIVAIPSTSGTYTITVTVTDSRGFTNTASKSISVYDYAPPVISSARVSRCTSNGTADNNGTYMKVYADYGFTNVNGKNAITSAYASYRVSGSGSSFTSAGNISDGTTILGSGQFNIGASYEVKLTVADTVGGIDTYTLTLGTAIAELNIGLNKVGVGKYAERDGYFEVGYKTKFENDVEFKNPEQVRGNLNITPAGIGALPASGGVINGNLDTENTNGESHVGVNFKGGKLYLYGNGSSGLHGLYDSTKGTVVDLNGSTAQFNGNASTASSVPGIDTSAFNAIQGVGGANLLESVKSTLENNRSKVIAARINYGPEAGMIGIYTNYSTGLAWAVVGQYDTLYHITGYYGDWQQNTIYTSRHFAWKKASVTFSNSIGTMSASGVTPSSTVLAIRGDSNVTGSYYSIGAADCNSAGTIKLAQANGSSTNATWTVSAWWSK